MSDNFNPYAQWLGLPPTVTSPSHYELLGIDESVTDPATIASAADRAMTRVRACRPGPQAAAWAQLLDRISAAKAALTNPTQRQSYNQESSTRLAPTAALANPNLPSPTNNATYPGTPQPPTAAIDPMAPMAPFSISPQPVVPQSALPTQAAAIPTAVPYLQPATPALAAPNPMAPAASAVPTAPMAPTVPQAVPDPMAPLVPSAPIAQAIPIAPSPMAPTQPAAIPVATPAPMQAVPLAAPPTANNASPVLASQPTATTPRPAIDGTLKLKRKPSAKARASSKSGGSLGPILLGGSVGGLIIVVIGAAFHFAGSSPKPSPRPVAAVPPTPLPPNGEVQSTIPRRLDEMPESERPRPAVFTPATSTSPRPEPSPETIPEPAPMTTPDPVTPTTPAPKPAPEPMSKSGPSREELRELAKSLTTARDAIGELNFAVFDRELAKALTLAKLDEHKAKISRLQLLRDYVGRFQAAIRETLGRVGAGEQIEFGEGKSFGIVEITPDLLVIRLSGSNFRYPMTELPLGLATRLAEMSLDKTSPDTSAMKAAFVSINPKIDDKDRATADAWWKEAASVGDVPDLITAINDDYSLKQDVNEVPLEPGAMEQLTARAERLKDARTIEEFAKEFQAAIDKSIKTLEPDTELSVGGSTVITIKELKPDRVMLTVAGETRGFQFTKLPLGLAVSIAERILPRDVPLSMVMKGAYYAAREKDQSNKQFRPFVLDWWKQAGEMDPQLQAVIQELVKQYPE